MTDISSATTHAEDPLGSLSATAALPSPPHPAPPTAASSRRGGGAPVTDGAYEDDDEASSTIKCICGFDQDDGSTVLCERCNTWQHISCYYPQAHDSNDVPEIHECVNCSPRAYDGHAAAARQRQRQSRDAHEVEGGRRAKKQASKSSKKKVKDTPAATAAAGAAPHINGWSTSTKGTDGVSGSERSAGSPRDQPPPAKRPKTTHRTSDSTTNAKATTQTRKRAGSSAHVRSPSRSPGLPVTNGITEDFSVEYMQLHRQPSGFEPSESNFFMDIGITHKLSTWLTDSDALADVTHGKMPQEIFTRWDNSMADLPAPALEHHVEVDDSVTVHGLHPTWQYLTIDSDVAPESYIGELKGRIGHREQYIEDPANRWQTLRHPEPFVFFHPHLPIYIDTRLEGSLLRYARRSCRPTVRMRIFITDATEYHFCFVANESLSAGSEVTVGWDMDSRILQLLDAQVKNGHSHPPDDQSYIRAWATKVLANFGGCACGNIPEACAMSRIRNPPMDNTIQTSHTGKVRRSKKANSHILPLNMGLVSNNSRAGSEGHSKMDGEDDNQHDSRSVSGSARSKPTSRDITPLYPPGDESLRAGPEVSSREMKKLMESDRLFQQMQNDQKRKKRHSGGSTLNTPSAATGPEDVYDKSRSLRPDEERKLRVDADMSALKRKGRSHDVSPRLMSPSTSSSQAVAAAKRHARKTGKSGANADSPTLPAPTYADACTQTDDGPAPDAACLPPRSKPRLLPLHNRLLKRCASQQLQQADRLNKRQQSQRPSDASEIKPPPQPPSPAVAVSTKPAPLPSPPMARDDVKMTDVGTVPVVDDALTHNAPATADVDMTDVATTAHPSSPPVPSPPSKSTDTADTVLKTEDDASSATSHPPILPVDPPWPKETLTTTAAATSTGPEDTATTKSEPAAKEPVMTNGDSKPDDLTTATTATAAAETITAEAKTTPMEIKTAAAATQPAAPTLTVSTATDGPADSSNDAKGNDTSNVVMSPNPITPSAVSPLTTTGGAPAAKSDVASTATGPDGKASLNSTSAEKGATATTAKDAPSTTDAASTEKDKDKDKPAVPVLSATTASSAAASNAASNNVATPSPIKKKMSLSDYTKRNKAAGNAKDTKDGAGGKDKKVDGVLAEDKKEE